MGLLSLPRLITRHDVRMVLIVTRREIRDTLRDWRIMIPIALLTLVFPVLANFTAYRMLGFTQRFGADVISERLAPFILLVVGFFPMSFSLVIALETFVGEKERKSLEPLLVTPLTNGQLYMGKMLAALLPPLLASYFGMYVYLLGLALTTELLIEPLLLLQILLLTLVQGIVMVAGAVVISSQTTSVRASNLLASFIIVPMALLLQFEAAVMFWGSYTTFLWWLIAGLLVTALVLMRMGIHLFNREELLGRDIDQLRLGWLVRQFWARFTGRDATGRYPGLFSWYFQLFALLPQLRKPTLVLLVAFVCALFLGVILSQIFPFPPALLENMTREQMIDNMSRLQLVLQKLPAYIVLHNLRVIALATILGLFTFGVLGLVIFILPWTVISFLAAQLALAGENPFLFILGTIVPHALFELPALLLAGAAALRWHAILIAPSEGQVISESWLLAAADFGRVLTGLVIPLLILAAVVESYVTPIVLMWVYGAS
jgi:uncharacterized membrane protein SpoIIM required for sporulation